MAGFLTCMIFVLTFIPSFFKNLRVRSLDYTKMTQSIETLIQPDGEKIAYCTSKGDQPGIIFLNGFMSDMQGTKAQYLQNYCHDKGYAFLRFDYFGHGESSGDFKEGTIGRWLDDTLAVIDQLTEGPQILVGSSMGGWLMLLAALRRPDRIKGLVGIATGADFTEDLILANATDEMHESWEKQGYFIEETESPDDFKYTITKELVREGRDHLLMRDPIPYKGFVHLIHGMKDADVPYENSLKIAALLESEDVNVTLVKNGGHRLSEPPELRLIVDAIEGLRQLILGEMES